MKEPVGHCLRSRMHMMPWVFFDRAQSVYRRFLWACQTSRGEEAPDSASTAPHSEEEAGGCAGDYITTCESPASPSLPVDSSKQPPTTPMLDKTSTLPLCFTHFRKTLLSGEMERLGGSPTQDQSLPSTLLGTCRSPSSSASPGGMSSSSSSRYFSEVEDGTPSPSNKKRRVGL
eukprot:Rmarinus@m.28481